ncbi:hypothetical protein RFI_31498, partial [Reticulomyxa filosa]
MFIEDKKEESESTETKTEEEKLIDNDDDNDGGDDEIVLKGVEQDNKERKSFPIKKKYCMLSTLVMIFLKGSTGERKKKKGNYKTKANIITCAERIDDPTAKEIEVREVDSETLENIVKYLNEHKGEEPPPLPHPVRSIEMSRNVSIKWDADFIDSFNKKAIFKIILVTFACVFICALQLLKSDSIFVIVVVH